MPSQEYDSEILKKLQKTELEILKDFVKICDKYNLPYFATGGTAIGALRHQGFIPWDDDIDVCMLRKDYEKFMEAAPQEMGERYVFMTTETEPRYPLMFGKMVKKGTRFVEEAYQQADYPLGIFIDIFPYDKTSEDPSRAEKTSEKDMALGKNSCTDPDSKSEASGWNRRMEGKSRPVGLQDDSRIFRLVHFTPQKSARHYLKWAKKCEESDSDLYIDYSYLTGDRLMIREKEMYPLKKVPFEDMEVCLVREYDSFLRPEYGDYMQLPPEDQRHNHCAAFIDFGENGG